MIRHRKLGRIELGVKDIERSRCYYQDVVGLQNVATTSAGELLLRCDHEHHSISLVQSATAGLRVAGFMLEDERQFDELGDRLAGEGLAVQEVPARMCEERFQSRAVRFREPRVGATIEFYTPLADSARPFEPTVARIQRLGHVVFNMPDSKDAVAFWAQVLNFKVSDAVGEMVTFMRCWPSPWHHGIGIAKAPVQSLHHVNYMVTEIDDIGRALARLREAGSDVVYGPGRHPASDSIFLYFLDPDGLTMEYSFGMEAFPEAHAREARQLPQAPEWLDYWGSRLDPRCFKGAGPNASGLLLESGDER